MRLARLVREPAGPHAPERFEASGLLALLLAQGSRQRTRSGADGVSSVPLDRQDRSLWDHAAVAEAGRWWRRSCSTPRTRAGRWAATPCRRPSPWSTPGPPGRPNRLVRVAGLHELLNRLGDVPAQRIAWAVAAGRAHGPRRGLEVLDGVRHGEDLHLFHAARADLLEAAGEPVAAEEAFARAAALAPGEADRAALRAKQRTLAGARDVPGAQNRTVANDPTSRNPTRR